ncbi:MAG: DUF1838 family protein [Alphaproteobacteria bacterium]
MNRKWFTGKVCAYRPGQPTILLFYMDGFYLTKYEALPNGTHLATRYEITIKRDIKIGELLDRWENPMTGHTNVVENSVGGPQKNFIMIGGLINRNTREQSKTP